MDPFITNYLSKLEFGELQTFGNMAVIPLGCVPSGQMSTPIQSGQRRKYRRNLIVECEKKVQAVRELPPLNQAESIRTESEMIARRVKGGSMLYPSNG